MCSPGLRPVESNVTVRFAFSPWNSVPEVESVFTHDGFVQSACPVIVAESPRSPSLVQPVTTLGVVCLGGSPTCGPVTKRQLQSGALGCLPLPFPIIVGKTTSQYRPAGSESGGAPAAASVSDNSPPATPTPALFTAAFQENTGGEPKFSGEPAGLWPASA